MPTRMYKTLAALVVPLVGLLGMAVVAPPPAAAATNTVVSLTFDDGQASQYAVAMSMMQPRGLVGTYYINSAMVGSSGYYMTWPQIHDIAAAGNEIGGHTLHHVNLNNVSESTARTEVCDDRSALIAQGFSPVKSFAYPEAAVNVTAEQIVKECGYDTGRSVGDLWYEGPYAETIPPQDPYRLRTAEGATTGTTLAELKASVTDAETHGGGWVSFVFHGICDNQCTNSNSVTTATFTAFLDWLAPRSADGTLVRTVAQAMSGSVTPPPPPPPVIPTTSIACNGSTCSTSWYNKPVEIKLTASGSGAVTRYTTDGSNPATSGIAYAGPFLVSSTSTVKYQSSTDNWATAEPVKSTVVRIDAAAPTVSLTSPSNGASFRQKARVSLTASAVDAGTSPGTPSGMARVRYFLDGATEIGTATASPYRVTWTVPRNLAPGTHTLTARAFDAAGNVTTSAGVQVTITRCTTLCL